MAYVRMDARYFIWDNKEYRLVPIGSASEVDQMVVLDKVGYDKDSADPMASYPHPAFFRIIAKSDNGYTLRDTSGRIISVDAGSGYHLFDIDAWFTWQKIQKQAIEDAADKRANRLKDRLELLKSILTAQGVKLITPDQAKQLGLDL